MQYIFNLWGDILLNLIFDIISKGFLFFALHIGNGNSFPPALSAKEEKEYFKRYKQGDSAAKNIIIEHNLRLVAHITKKYCSNTNEQDDLISIGTIGLIKAVNTFDDAKGIKFATYASKCIENEVLMYFRSLKKSAQDISINEPIDSDSDGNPLTLMDIISVDDTIADEINHKMQVKKLYEYIEKIKDEREKNIIILRYGLYGVTPLTQKQIAKRLNISRSYVSRIEKKVVENLRKKFYKNEKAAPKGTAFDDIF